MCMTVFEWECAAHRNISRPVSADKDNVFSSVSAFVFLRF